MPDTLEGYYYLSLLPIFSYGVCHIFHMRANCCWFPCFCCRHWCCRPIVAFIPAVAVVPAVDGILAVASFPADPGVPMSL